MQINTIDDIFDANRAVRTRLVETLADISEAEAAKAIIGQPWSVAQIVEHISLVEEGSSKICRRLLLKAEADNALSDGTVKISDTFRQKAKEIDSMKLQAPQVVQPIASNSLAQSFEKMAENERRFQKLRPLFMSFDGTDRKFPHPFFGEISAQEWLLLAGYHEERHLHQLKRLMTEKK